MPPDSRELMNIRTATSEFERWLTRFTKLDAADLRFKHAQMSQEVFRFFRGTYYRWAQCWAETCRAEADAPRVLAVGDLHVENFGTWRDAEGRLIWGVNDFDEASPLPYTNDLIRLATSGIMALKSCSLQIRPRDLCERILAGYRLAIAEGGRPIVLEEEHPTLRVLALNRLREPAIFWPKFNKNLGKRPAGADPVALRILSKHWPAIGGGAMPPMRVRPCIGMGSLGKPRYAVAGQYAGAWIAREVKAITPSASAWATGGDELTNYYQQILDSAVRCSDPFAKPCEGWLVRRLAPDCSRIELATLEQVDDEAHLLRAMGWETANIHLNARGNASRILADLKKRPDGWLKDAAKAMHAVCRQDWEAWRSGRGWTLTRKSG
jgi:hypothetical protein